jgi:hypothetical protein
MYVYIKADQFNMSVCICEVFKVREYEHIIVKGGFWVHALIQTALYWHVLMHIVNSYLWTNIS